MKAGENQFNYQLVFEGTVNRCGYCSKNEMVMLIESVHFVLYHYEVGLICGELVTVSCLVFHCKTFKDFSQNSPIFI